MKNLITLFACLLIFVCTTGLATANALDSWTLRHSGGSGSLGDVEYGNGVFVAVGSSPPGTIIYSNDGVSWTDVTSTVGSASLLSGLAFGNGFFVATGSGGEVRRSSDGISWAPQVGNTGATLSCATYGNGMFVAGGSAGTVIVSEDDGITLDRIYSRYSMD